MKKALLALFLASAAQASVITTVFNPFTGKPDYVSISSGTGGSGSPAGATTQVQFNNAGSFAGAPSLTVGNTGLITSSSTRTATADFAGNAITSAHQFILYGWPGPQGGFGQQMNGVFAVFINTGTAGNVGAVGSGAFLQTQDTGQGKVNLIANFGQTVGQGSAPAYIGQEGEGIYQSGNYNGSIDTSTLIIGLYAHVQVRNSVGVGISSGMAYDVYAPQKLGSGSPGNSWTFYGIDPDPSTFVGKVFLTTASVYGAGGLSVSYGASVGTMSFTSGGNFSFQNNNGDSNFYQAWGSSVAIPAGHIPVASSTYSFVDGGLPSSGGGTPGGSSGQIQYNSASVFAGVPGTFVTASSVTLPLSVITSTLSVVARANGVSGNTTPGIVDIYDGSPIPNGILFSIGSVNQHNQFIVQDQQPLNLSAYGLQAGFLLLGTGVSEKIIANGIAASQYLNMDNGGEIDLQSTTSGNGGKDIVILPLTTEALRISGLTSSTVANDSATVKITGILTKPYVMTIGTTTAGPFYVSVSTNGHTISNGPSPSISSCGSTPNGSVIGTDQAGIITVGGGSVTGCVMTFASTYGVGCTVSCTISDSITTATPDVTATPTTMTTGFSASIGGGTISYDCEGIGSACR